MVTIGAFEIKKFDNRFGNDSVQVEWSKDEKNFGKWVRCRSAPSSGNSAPSSSSAPSSGNVVLSVVVTVLPAVAVLPAVVM